MTQKTDPPSGLSTQSAWSSLTLPQPSLAQLNLLTESRGLSLSQEGLAQLILGRQQALATTGRVEFCQGILPQLVYTFCDSPFLCQQEYQATLAELQSLFYHFKNITKDRLSDEELLEAMAFLYNGPAQGALAYLAHQEAEGLETALRLAQRRDTQADPTAATHPHTYTDAPLDLSQEDERYEPFYQEDVYDYEDGALPLHLPRRR